MTHFGLKRKRPYYQFEDLLLFYDPGTELEIYPGIPSGQFVYLVVNWNKVEIKKLEEAFTFYLSEPIETHYRIIIPADIKDIHRIDIVITYPDYIDIFIDNKDYAFDYAHQGRLELPQNIEQLYFRFPERLSFI